MSDVGEWLRGLGLGQYADAFAEQGIEFDLLCELSDADLAECGVAALGHRKRMLKAIAELGTLRAAVPIVAEGVAPARSESAAAGHVAQRRQVSVMFCDMVGATALSTETDPEDLRRIVAAYHRVVQRAVAPFEGYVAQLLGDGVLVFFGYPRAHEDGAIRAVRAADAVVRAVGSRDFGGGLRLQTRIGIATGLVVIGEIGAGTPAAETGVTGETPNLAARLQARAPPMGVLVSEQTRQQIGEVFRLEALGAIRLKGFARPQPAWRVLGERASGTRFEALRGRRIASFVGRDAELELLVSRWALARDAEGQAVLLSGEAGIGKSRICQELRAHVEQQGAHVEGRDAHVGQRRAGVVTLQCQASHQGVALHPMVRWLQESADLRPEDDAAIRTSKLAAALAARGCALTGPHARSIELLASTDDPAPDLARIPADELRLGVRRALVELLLALARPGPLLLLVEDAHWADPATEEMVADLLPRLRGNAVLVLLTARPEYQPQWAGSRSVTRLSLNRLARAACARILDDVAGKSVPNAVVEEILARTDGVPLFVEELTRTVVRSGLLAETDRGWQLEGSLHGLAVPATLQDSLMARLDRLLQAREVAQIAAAIGREFDARVVAAVMDTSVPQLRASLTELEEAAVVVPAPERSGSVYVFRHALIRDVAYGSTLKTVRAGYHGRIARAIEQIDPEAADTQPEILAMHYEQAGDGSRAWPLWVKAGELAIRRAYAFAQSLGFFERALEILRRGEPDLAASTCDVLLLEEAVLGRLGRQTEQMRVIGEALAIAERLQAPERLAGVLLRLANACAYLGKAEQAQQAGHRALEIYRACANRAGEAEALRELGFLRWRSEDYPNALRFAREALATNRSLGNVAAEATALHNLAEIHRSLGSPKQALEWYRQALQLHWSAGNREGEILTLFGTASALQQTGDHAAARRSYEQARALSERYGERTMQSRALQALAVDARARGEVDQALDFMRRAIDVDRAIGYAHALGHDLVELCAIHLERGELEDARAALREALDWCESSADLAAATAIRGWLAALDEGRRPDLGDAVRPGGVKTHLPLPEGKVYCEFESPLAANERVGPGERLRSSA